MLGSYHIVLVVRIVAGIGLSVARPQIGVTDVLALSQVSQRDEVTRIRRRTRLVRHPHLHAGDGDACRDVG